MIDCDDEDCRWNGACMENICDDGIDNDGDGDIEIVVALMKSTSNKIYVWNSRDIRNKNRKQRIVKKYVGSYFT